MAPNGTQCEHNGSQDPPKDLQSPLKVSPKASKTTPPAPAARAKPYYISKIIFSKSRNLENCKYGDGAFHFSKRTELGTCIFGKLELLKFEILNLWNYEKLKFAAYTNI